MVFWEIVFAPVLSRRINNSAKADEARRLRIAHHVADHDFQWQVTFAAFEEPRVVNSVDVGANKIIGNRTSSCAANDVVANRAR